MKLYLKTNLDCCVCGVSGETRVALSQNSITIDKIPYTIEMDELFEVDPLDYKYVYEFVTDIIEESSLELNRRWDARVYIYERLQRSLYSDYGALCPACQDNCREFLKEFKEPKRRKPRLPKKKSVKKKNVK